MTNMFVLFICATSIWCFSVTVVKKNLLGQLSEVATSDLSSSLPLTSPKSSIQWVGTATAQLHSNFWNSGNRQSIGHL